MIEVFGLAVGQQALVLGAVTGLAYAALAAGFVLVYRSTGVLNLAHGEIGAFGAALFVLLLAGYSFGYWLAFALAVLAAAAVAMTAELVVVRRLFRSPRLVLLIATVGLGKIVAFGKLSLPSVIAPGPIGAPFDAVWTPTAHIRLQAREIVVLIVVPVLIAALAWFMARTRFGLAVRASASNPDTARLYGISPRRTSTVVWTISGAFAAATAILLAPLQGVNSAQAGTAAIAEPLLLRVLVVSLLARMRSLPATLAGGVAVGVAEQLVRSNVASADRSVVDLYLFAAVLVAVLVAVQRRGADGDWSLSPRSRAAALAAGSPWWARRIDALGLAALFALLAVLGLWLSSSSALFAWTAIVLFAMVALSLSVLTGWAGQLSLGQYAFVGLGGMTVVGLTAGHDVPIPFDLFDLSLTLPWAAAVAVATGVGVAAAVLVGLPALRVRGLFLAVTTLAFAVASASWLLTQDFFTGGTSTPRSPNPPVVELGPVLIDFGASRRSFFFLCLGSLAVVAVVVARLRRTGIGRCWIAVRDNEEAATAATVSPTRMKLSAFAVAGGIAAYSGGLLVTLLPSLQPAALFGAGESVVVVATAIIGGLGSVAGPILGALWVRGIPQLAPDELDSLVRLITSDIGLLVLLMYLPGGLLSVVHWARDAIVARASAASGQRSRVDGAKASAEQPAESRRPAGGSCHGRGFAAERQNLAPVPPTGLGGSAPEPESARGAVTAGSGGGSGLGGSASKPESARGAVTAGSGGGSGVGGSVPEPESVSGRGGNGLALEARGVTVRFGGNVAVDGVSISVSRGELVGLIGANGAGKSTLFNAISGFVPASGRVLVMGRDVTRRRAPARHSLGLGRGFQAARLYPELTVRESVMVALEARRRSRLLASATGLPPSPASERRKQSEAGEIVDYLGLGRYADSLVADLSTGTRRIVELGCLLAARARVMLLDEPTAGVAQRETEAFGPLIAGVRDELGAAAVVIEHDMGLVMGISDRIYCLESGSVIAEGPPAAVRSDPRVIASYLGTDERTIRRSGAVS